MEIIIVLGISKDGVYQKRVDRAIAHFLSSPYEEIDNITNQPVIKKMILVTGTPGNADDMYNHANKFVDKRFLLKENASRTTVDNINFSLKLILTKFLLCNIKLTICTSTYHIERSILITDLLCAGRFPTKFIHTNEIVTPEQLQTEQGIANKFLYSYIQHKLK